MVQSGLPRLELTPEERCACRHLAEETIETLGVTSHLDLERRLTDLTWRAHGLPGRLRCALTQFRLGEYRDGGLVIGNLPVEEEKLGPTPGRYDAVVGGTEVTVATCVLLLLGSLVGEPFSFLSQQFGRLVLDVFPVAGHENQQVGSSSITTLEWHNEDAFDADRADWLMLLCLRNADGVPTIFGSVEGLEVAEEHWKTLFDERFVIRPDESHTAEFNSATTGTDSTGVQDAAFARIRSAHLEPCLTSVLSGDPRLPFVQIDPEFMTSRDERGTRALAAMRDAVEARLLDVVLASGDLLVIDNKRAVHGRRPFRARYDGTDRWLRRVNLTADLRKSAARRAGAHGRALS
jgi:Fe(II)/alpha-ketoglutarate-dependent arginine beta-hydroxylase